MNNSDFYKLSGQQHNPHQMGSVDIGHVKEQPSPQFSTPVTKPPPTQPHQKLNLISSQEAEALRSGEETPLITRGVPLPIDREMIEMFMRGVKNPIMALNEFCQKQRLTVKFQEESAAVTAGMFSKLFASVAVVDGVRYTKGVGKTKKDAKTLAAKIALSTLLGLTADDVLEKDCGQTGYETYDEGSRSLSEEKSYSHGGHFQMNTTKGPTLTSPEVWNVPGNMNYAEYQAGMVQRQEGDQCRQVAEQKEACKPPLNSLRGASVMPGVRPTTHKYQPGQYGDQTGNMKGLGPTTKQGQSPQMTPSMAASQPLWPAMPYLVEPETPAASGSNDIQCPQPTGYQPGAYHPSSSESDSYNSDLPQFPELKPWEPDHGTGHSKFSKPTGTFKPYVEPAYDFSGDLDDNPFPKTHFVRDWSSTATLSDTCSPTLLLSNENLHEFPSIPAQTPADKPFNQPSKASELYERIPAQTPADKPYNQLSKASEMYPSIPAQVPADKPYNQPSKASEVYPSMPTQTPSNKQPLDSPRKNDPQPTESFPTVADHIANIARSIPKVGAPFPGCKNIGIRKSYAVFLLQRRPQADHEIVSVGTGYGSVAGRSLTMDGRVLVDLCGVTVAKRGLQRFLYRELKNFYKGTRHMSIFTSQPSSSLLKIKQDVSLHLYINAAPCGDGERFTSYCSPSIPENDLYMMAMGAHYPTLESETAQGQLTAKGDEGPAVPVADLQRVESFEMAKKEKPLRIMSCSDKLLKWNIIGLQGALLSQLIEPIYLETITLGNGYHHGHLSRAMCCRVDDSLTDILPQCYSVHHPLIGRVSHTTPNEDDSKTGASLNWSYADSLYEVVDARQGICTEGSPFKAGLSGASRLCKAAFYSRFKDACNMAQRYDLQQASNYLQAKIMCSKYYSAKAMFVDHLRTKGYGNWLHLPLEMSKFTK